MPRVKSSSKRTKKDGKLSFFIAVYGGRFLSVLRTSGRHGRPSLDSLIRLRRIPCTGPNSATRLLWGFICYASSRQEPAGWPPRDPAPGGVAAPVVQAPAGQWSDGSHADMRGAVPTLSGGRHGVIGWLFSHLIHFVSGQGRTGPLTGRCTANSKYMKRPRGR